MIELGTRVVVTLRGTLHNVPFAAEQRGTVRAISTACLGGPRTIEYEVTYWVGQGDPGMGGVGEYKRISVPADRLREYTVAENLAYYVQENQWSGETDGHGCATCRECYQFSHKGHADTCRLAALLRSAKTEDLL